MYNHVYMMFQSSILSLLMAIKIYSKSLKVTLTVQYWLFINWQVKKRECICYFISQGIMKPLGG